MLYLFIKRENINHIKFSEKFYLYYYIQIVISMIVNHIYHLFFEI